jgi:hypothetical protein
MPARLRSTRQAGQALLETLIVAMLISVAMGLMLVWAKLQSIDQAAAAAARSIAFECASVRVACPSTPGRDDVSRSVVRRFLGEGDREVLSGDRMMPDSVSSTIRSFWRGLDGRSILRSTSPIPSRASASFDAGIHVAARVPGVTADTTALLNRVGPERFGFDPRGGLAVTRLELSTLTTWPGAAWSGAIGAESGHERALSFEGRAAILADAWNAAVVHADAGDSVADRVRRARRLDPAVEAALDAGYGLARGALRTASGVGLEPLGRHFNQGAIDVSIVPADRVRQP